MSYNGHLVIDMDQHIREYVDLDRTYRDYIDLDYRAPFELLSQAVARRREAGMTTALFMNPQAIIEPSDSQRPLGVQDTFGAERTTFPPVPQGYDIPPSVNWDPSIRLTDMDKMGIDKTMTF